MTPENTSRLVLRLTEKLDELEAQLTLDTDSAIDQFEEHRKCLKGAIHCLPESLDDLEKELADETLDLKQRLGELEVNLALARMETEDAYREQRRGIFMALSSLESTIQKIETAEDEQGLVHYKDFAKRARRLEDKLGALHVHFELEKTHTGEALEEEKEELRKSISKISAGLKSAKTIAIRDLKTIGKNIRESSEIMWGCLKEFMQYIETEEQRHEREEMKKKIID